MELLSAVVLGSRIRRVRFERRQFELKAVKGAEVIEALWKGIEGGFKDGESIQISFGSSENMKKKEEEEEEAYERLLPIRRIRLSRVFSVV